VTTGGSLLRVRVLAAAVAGVLTVSVAGAQAAAGVSDTTIAQIADDAAWIRSGQLPDGAIAWYVDKQHISPYLANYAAIGLAEAYKVTGDAADLDAATSWLQWYAAHEGPDGVVTDYNVNADGSETSTGDEDSTDGYAGTFLMAVQAVYRAGASTATMQSLAAGVQGAVQAINLTRDTDGLTWAKPAWHVKYLMDQVEADAGLVAAVSVAPATGQQALAGHWLSAEIAVSAGIDGLWDPATTAYDWAKHDNGVQVSTDWSRLYSDAMEQAWMAALMPLPAGRAATLMGAVTAYHPQWDQPAAIDQFSDGTRDVGYWPVAGWGLLKTGQTQAAASAAASIRATATARNRAWDYTTGSAGELIILESGDLSLLSATPATYRQVVSGSNHSCGLSIDGTVKCWGSSTGGLLGIGVNDGYTYPAMSVPGLTDVTELSAGGDTTCALADGAVLCWGDLGSTHALTPTQITLPTAATQVAASSGHACAVLADQSVYCWGANAWFQSGPQQGQGANVSTPQQIAGLDGAVGLAAGGSHTCALTERGRVSTVSCWGSNASYQLGRTTGYTSAVPLVVSGLGEVTQVVAGDYHSCALTSAATVSCWGAESTPGSPQTSDATPAVVQSATGGALGDVQSVQAGGGHTCALRSDQTLACWGRNHYGQLGTGSTSSYQSTASVVSGIANAVQLTTGSSDTCASASDGTTTCWGNNLFWQLGYDTGMAHYQPDVASAQPLT
jgi:alpha-tubulin suppressor-like RCC1 family protein